MYLSYSGLIVAYPRNDHGISHPGRRPGTVRVEQTILAEPGAIVSWSFWSRNGKKNLTWMASFFQWGEPFIIILRHHKRSIRRNWCRIIQQTAFLLLQQLKMMATMFSFRFCPPYGSRYAQIGVEAWTLNLPSLCWCGSRIDCANELRDHVIPAYWGLAQSCSQVIVRTVCFHCIKPVLSGCRRHSSNTEQFHGSCGLVTAPNGLQTQEPDKQVYILTAAPWWHRISASVQHLSFRSPCPAGLRAVAC